MKKRTLKEDFINSINQLRCRPNGEVLESLIESLENDNSAVAVRFNSRKIGTYTPRNIVPWCPCGSYIYNQRPRFTFDPSMHQGIYYVQDPSSMILRTIVEHLKTTLPNSRPLVYIDACAAPGGKTTAAIDALPEDTLVISNEFDRKRADILCENIIKWGYPNIVVTQGDTAKFTKLGEIADIVATDVPCSGEGMMRKDETAIQQWTPQLVEQCAELQRSIIDNMWKALRPGGFFIYSTCTFNHAEDEENLAYLIEELGAEPYDLDCIRCNFPQIAGAVDSPYPAMRFIPGRIDGEGLFVAVVHKPDPTQSIASPIKSKNTQSKAKGQQNRKKSEANINVDNWIKSTGYEIVTDGDKITALPSEWRPLIDDIKKKLNVIYCGVELATTKGHDIIPSQALALSTIANRNFPRIDVDYTTAINYLSRQAITLPDGTPKGFVLLTYNDSPLGFVKNLGNRANNLYPQAWAIRSGHIPDEPPMVISLTSSDL